MILFNKIPIVIASDSKVIEHRFILWKQIFAEIKEYYNLRLRTNFGIEITSFDPFTYINAYKRLKLMDEVYCLTYLSQIIGYHPKTKWNLLAELYLNGSTEPYLTWRRLVRARNINKYLIEKVNELLSKKYNLGSYYKQPRFNTETAKHIADQIKHYQYAVGLYENDIEKLHLKMDEDFFKTLPLKKYLIYYRYYQNLIYLDIKQKDTIKLELNSQLMIKKSLRHLFNEKQHISNLNQLYIDLLDTIEEEPRELLLCDSLITYYHKIIKNDIKK